MRRVLNLGILAHVDAGKTSLTERLLHAAGVIDEIGRVDEGSTQTDSLALERRRGITIKSAVVSFTVDDVTVNLIDTPGHPDFIAEVERVLGVLDGAVLVLSAVEGVQPQTRILMRALRRLRIPTLLFVNKIDRRGARCAEVVDDIARKLDVTAIPMGVVRAEGSRDARAEPYRDDDPVFVTRLADALTGSDDELLAEYVDDERALTPKRLWEALAEQTAAARVHPVYFGSAVTGAGLEALRTGVAGLLPPSRDPGGKPGGVVFKVERGEKGRKRVYVRVFSGTFRTRDRVPVGDRGDTARITGIEVFDAGTAASRPEVSAGRIAVFTGLEDARIGDRVGTPPPGAVSTGHFAPPTLETVVAVRRPGDDGRLYPALSRMAEQDPLIAVRRDDRRGETYVSLYGEVQKEVIAATLAEDFGIDVDFHPTTTVCVERPVGTGAAVEFIAKEPNPFLATVGLRVAPAPEGTGVRFELEVELGSMPFAFMKAVEETVYETLRQGLHGWRVHDCVVTLTHSGYWARQSSSHGTFDKSMSSTAGDFRLLTPLVLTAALREAGTRVFEPLHRFRLESPHDCLGAVLTTLTALRAVPDPPLVSQGECVVEGLIPAASVHPLQRRLPGLTGGDGVLDCAFDCHRPVTGPVPSRPRWDHNPLNRREYLLNVTRRVT